MCRKPNLIYILADQLRYQSCGFAGDRRARTPNLDGLASQSANFVNAVSVFPVCAPYRASLFTGKYPSSTGMVINELRMNPHHECIGHVLGNADYDTSYIGKWHLWSNVAGDHMDMANQFTPPGPHRLGFDGYWAGHNFNHSYNNAYYFEDKFERVDVNGYEPDVQTDMAMDVIEKSFNRETPHALFLCYGTPHDPWMKGNVPEEYAAMFDESDFGLPQNYADGSAEFWSPGMTREWWMQNVKPNLPGMQRLYYAMTANLDWNVGRLLDALERSGQADDTIVVFASDHGEMFGAHGRVAKAIFYEEAARVPFLIRWPGHIPEGLVSDACLNTPDVMPTLLSLMGLQPPETVEGMDLSHIALAEPGPEPEAAFMQGMGHTYMWLDGFEWRALRDKRYTYAVARGDGQEYLFDNQSDPLQMSNLCGNPDYSEVLEKFRRMLEARMAELGDTFECCTWYRDHWMNDRCIERTATLNA